MSYRKLTKVTRNDIVAQDIQHDRDVLSIRRDFLRLADMKTGAMLAYCEKVAGRSDDWFAISMNEFTEGVVLTRFEQDRCRKKLLSISITEPDGTVRPIWREKRVGMPAALRFKIDWQALEVAAAIANGNADYYPGCTLNIASKGKEE